MNIIQEAKLKNRHIKDNRQLFERQKETLIILLDHKAISQMEYDRSLKSLTEKMDV